jgi:phage terminase large subunit GpA-like protein
MNILDGLKLPLKYTFYAKKELRRLRHLWLFYQSEAEEHIIICRERRHIYGCVICDSNGMYIRDAKKEYDDCFEKFKSKPSITFLEFIAEPEGLAPNQPIL